MFVRANARLGLHTYAEAKRYYESIDPIRGNGKNAGIRPMYGSSTLYESDRISGRRKPYMEMQFEGGDYACYLYNTDVVRFKPDNTIVVNCGGWNTISTNNFIASVLGVAAFRHNNRQWIASGLFRTWEAMNKVAVCISDTGDNIFKWNEEKQQYDITPAEVATRRVINREKTKELMKPYTDFRKYVTRMAKLQSGERELSFSGDAVAEMKYQSDDWILEAAKNGRTPVAYYKVLCACIAEKKLYRNRYFPDRDVTVSVQSIMQVIRSMVYKRNYSAISKIEPIKSMNASRNTI